MGEVIQETEISGLRLERNLYTSSPDRQFYSVVASDGPGISDVVTHSPTFSYTQYGIHVAQVDRLTFFGNPDKKVTGHFVDCREGSPTLHRKVTLELRPDPTVLVHIDRGVAHTFDGLENITTRDEPVWYLSADNPHYNIANDVVNIDRSEPLENFPVVRVNEYPIPRQAYEFMLKVQHVTLMEMRRYPSRFQMDIDGEKRYVSLIPKGKAA
ncbi:MULTISPECIES: hypothetical protein [unclassified Streptomyces]|uniref:hypothetical protein n=1 Tax=unclassified Streptomyces TaxID=2593676 RepID=UPI002F9159C0